MLQITHKIDYRHRFIKQLIGFLEWNILFSCLKEVNTVKLSDKKERARIANISFIAW